MVEPIGTEMNSNRNILLAIGLVASLSGEAGAAGLYETKTTAAVQLPAAGWYYVAHLVVPAGTWVVQALSPAVNFGAADIMRCMIWVNGTQRNASAAMMGGGDGMPAAVPVPNLAVVSLAYSTNVVLYCGHDGTWADQRIDPGASLVVTRAPAN
jgi:hypothetical protein